MTDRNRSAKHFTRQEAEAIEKEAHEMKKASLKGMPYIFEPGAIEGEIPTPEKVASRLEGAGNVYKDIGMPIKAESLYREAKMYGYTFSKEDTKRIDKKINNLHINKSLKFHFPHSKLETEVEEITEKNFGQVSLAIISILTLLGALVFSAFNLTGYAVAGMTLDNYKIISMCLFVCGLVFAFI